MNPQQKVSLYRKQLRKAKLALHQATRAGRSQQEREDRVWELGRQYGQEHPLAEVTSTEEMYQAAREVDCAWRFDLFKYGAQEVWRETGQMKKAAVRNISTPALEAANEALTLLQDVKADALIRQSHYNVVRAAQQAISQVEYLIEMLQE